MVEPNATKGERIPLVGRTRESLRRELAHWDVRSFRFEQLYRAVNLRGVETFDEISDLGLEQRQFLRENCTLGRPRIERSEVSRDGTVKYLLRLEDQSAIEAVAIPDGQRRTLCLSTQAGCALACRFCVTGYWGAGRNLSPSEIVGQLLEVARYEERSVQSFNIVFMGMGEPLLNLAAVEESIEVLLDLVSRRRVTVSTAGVVPAIEAMATWSRRPNLAISLHAPDDTRRSHLMPINRKYPLDTLLRSLRRFPLERGRRLTFEYILLAHWNDSPADARELAQLLRGLRAKVNLIPFNPDAVLPADLRPPTPARALEFQRQLLAQCLPASIRWPKGRDVSAACGQLRAPDRPPRGFPGGVAEMSNGQ